MYRQTDRQTDRVLLCKPEKPVFYTHLHGLHGSQACLHGLHGLHESSRASVSKTWTLKTGFLAKKYLSLKNGFYAYYSSYSLIHMLCKDFLKNSLLIYMRAPRYWVYGLCVKTVKTVKTYMNNNIYIFGSVTPITCGCACIVRVYSRERFC